MGYLKIELKDKELRDWVKRYPNILRKNTSEAMRYGIDILFAESKRFVPKGETGSLSDGILKGGRIITADGERAYLKWIELNERRESSFESSKWNGRFLEWMEQSPNAKVGKFPWRTGSPDFFRKAMISAKTRLIKKFEIAFSNATK